MHSCSCVPMLASPARLALRDPCPALRLARLYMSVSMVTQCTATLGIPSLVPVRMHMYPGFSGMGLDAPLTMCGGWVPGMYVSLKRLPWCACDAEVALLAWVVS